ncbi:retrovirus-related pol polyprotein from transposon TNT 1-94 [Tanacetum coccineum]
MLRHVSLEERPIVVLGLRGGLLGANPIPHRTGRAVWHDRAVWHEPEQFSSELNNISLPCLYSLFVRAVCAGAIYRTEVCTEVCADRRLSISEEALGAFGKSQTYRYPSEDIQRICELFVKCIGHRYRGRGYDRGQEAEQKQVEIMEDKRDKDKVVNMAAGDSDDALVCCVENTVEDRIIDSGASFHATYCKEELDRFRLCSGKVRLTDDKILDIASVGDVFLKTSFGTSWTLKDVRYISSLKRRLISVGQLDEEGYHHQRLGDMSRIGMSMLASKGNVPDVQKVDIYFCKPCGLGKQKNISFIMSLKTRKLQSRSCDRYNANLQFGVAIRLSRTFRAESKGIRAEAPKMLWADSVSTAYLIYCIPYIPIRLRIPEEEWRGKDTSLTHLKPSGYEESLVIRSRDITFVDSIYEARSATYSSSLTKPIQKSQVVLIDIPNNLLENDSLAAEHGLSSKITQSPGGSSDTSEGSKNSKSFEDSGRSDEKDSKDRAFFEEGGFETPQRMVNQSYSEALSSKEFVQWKKTINEEMVSLEKNQTCSLVRISAGKKASQRLWMFKVKEEQDGSKRYKALLMIKGFQQKQVLSNCEDDYNQPGFSASWAERKPRVHIEGNSVRTDSSTEATPVKEFDDMLVADSDMAEFNKPKWQFPLVDVHQVGDEREVEVLRSFNWPPSELITEDGVLPERGYSQFNDVSSGYLVSKVS